MYTILYCTVTNHGSTFQILQKTTMAYFSGYCHPNNQPECEKCDYESDESDSAILNCIVGQSPSLESGMYVEALPDSGCDMSTISEYMAMQIGVRVLRTQKNFLEQQGQR